MISESFKTEQNILNAGEAVLKKKDSDVNFRREYQHLLKSYKKLLKVSDRLMRVSDRNEHKLKMVNTQISRQQAELEKTHEELSWHAEILESKVSERTRDLKTAQEKLEKLVEIGIALSKERNLNRFKHMILSGAKELTNADGGGFLLFDENTQTLKYQLFSVDSLDLHFGGNSGREIPFDPILLRDPKTQKPFYYNLIAHAALTRCTVNVNNISQSKDFDFTNIQKFDSDFDYRSQSYLAVPLKQSQGEIVGILVLFNARIKGTGRVRPFSEEMSGFVEGLASQAAVALVNQQLLDSQQQLLDSLIKLIASAIDAKSPYTGGHSERVVILSEMLAKAACEAEEGAWADFDMQENEWREFQIACWLHDCGKVTTPEYVVDKATKLETIYNRIHEVRARFEILHRDKIIAYQEQLLTGKQNPEKLQKDLDESLNQLQNDFAFVAQCNVGGEFMDEQKQDRLDAISKIQWKRFFDDRLGLSEAELHRLKNGAQPAVIPANEYLLSDRQDHIIPWPEGGNLYDPEKYGFRVKIPAYMYNKGECYNLKVARGTLTEEERYKIMEHAIQTIIMLEKLPFPKHLSEVVNIAGAHHETLVGSGYPKKLNKDTLPLKARIMAIADVFEALTAKDRPYKKAKTLSEAIRILGFMKKDGHIDGDLLDLFLSSGAYLKYAKRFLDKQQIDENCN